MSAFDGGVKQTLRGHALMSACDRKRRSGQRSLNGRAARKRPLAKKIANTGGVSFLRFQNWRTGVLGRGHAVFRISSSAAGRRLGCERSGRFGFICAPSASRGHGVERASDPLHRAWVNAKALGNATYAFTSPLTFVQGGLDSFLDLEGYGWTAKLFALVLGP